MSLFGDIVGALGVGVSAYNAFKGPPEPPQEYLNLLGKQNQIMNALMNPNDPLFLEQAEAEEKKINRDLASALKEVALADARQRGRSGFGILPSERRDESIAYAASRGAANAKQQARVQARNYLSQAMGGSGIAAGSYGPVLQNQRDQYQSQNLGFATLFQGVGNLLDTPTGKKIGDQFDTAFLGTS